MASELDVVVAPEIISAPSRRSTKRLGVLLIAGVGVIALLVRLIPVLRGGGLDFYGRYDDAVYFTASEALTFGRVPYRSFVLLHPPGLILALVPFAILGRLTTDPTGMAAGRLAFMAIGGLNAALVATLAKRWGWIAAVTAGLLYACWMPAVYGEQSTMLEPLATTSTLVALLLLCRPGNVQVSHRAEVLAGVALGLSLTFKIWYAAPFLVILLWLLSQRRFRSTLRIMGGASASASAILLPFFVLAPSQMFRMVVLDQVERSGRISVGGRMSFILGVRPLIHDHQTAALVVTEFVVVLVGVAALYCVRDAAARVIVALLGVNLLILLTAPDYYLHYGELTAAPIALVVGIGLAKIHASSVWQWLARGLVGVVGLVVVLSGLRIVTTPTGDVFPTAAFDATAPTGCVTADDPQALIDMNRLTTDLRAGCTVPVDVSGITYDRLAEVNAKGKRLSRVANPAWQRYLHDYLFSGSSFVVLRDNVDMMSPEYRSLVNHAPVLASSDGLTLRAGLT
jgi:hypothetical protein